MKKVTFLSTLAICIAITHFVIQAKAAPQNSGHEYVVIYYGGGSKAVISSTDKGEYEVELSEKNTSGCLKKIKEFENQGWKIKLPMSTTVGSSFKLLLEK